jgi:hypothetical protein
MADELYVAPPYPPPLASKGHAASKDGWCVMCGARIVRGQRIAMLASDDAENQWAHCFCIAQQAR